MICRHNKRKSVGFPSHKKEIRAIAQALNVKVRFSKKTKHSTCFTNKRMISIVAREDLSRNQLLSYFFHEYSHQVCYDLHIYNDYHRGDTKSTEFRECMVEAEIFVDKMGEEFMFLYDSEAKYEGGYLKSSKEEIEGFLRRFYKLND